MAIDRILLAANINAPGTWYNGVRIKAGATPPNPLYVTWHTDKYMPDGEHPCHDSFVIKARWVGIKKGADPNYGSYPASYKPTVVQRANCFHQRDGSGAIWKYDIAQLLPTTTPFEPFRNNDS